MDRPVVALVGCGRWGRHILRDLVQLGCDVPVVARSEASIERARSGGAKTIVSTIGDLPPVDGVVVATTTSSHADAVLECIRLGCPVFVEKPLTTDLGSAERLAALAPDRLFVMDKWRYHPGVEALAAIARSGELGAVVGLRTTRVGWGHPHADVDAVWMLAPHDLAIVVEVLGELPQVRVAAAERMNGDPTGLVAVLGEHPWATLDLSTSSYERRRAVQLVCHEGTAWLADGYADHIGVARGDRLGVEPERREISSEFPLLRELRVFVEHLKGGPSPRSDAQAGVEVVRRVEQLRAAAGLEAAVQAFS